MSELDDLLASLGGSSPSAPPTPKPEDDDELTWYERLVKSLQSSPAQLGSTMLSAAEAAVELNPAQRLTSSLFPSIAQGEQDALDAIRQRKAILDTAGGLMRPPRDQNFLADVSARGPVMPVAERAIESLPTTLASLAATMALGPAAALGVTATMEGVPAYSQARQSGSGIYPSAVGATAQGLGSGYLERLGAKGIAEAAGAGIKPLAQRLLALGKSSLQEGGTEIGQESIAVARELAMGEMDTSDPNLLSKIVARLAEAGSVGVGSATAIGGSMQAVEARTPPRTTQEPTPIAYQQAPQPDAFRDWIAENEPDALPWYDELPPDVRMEAWKRTKPPAAPLSPLGEQPQQELLYPDPNLKPEQFKTQSPEEDAQRRAEALAKSQAKADEKNANGPRLYQPPEPGEEGLPPENPMVNLTKVQTDGLRAAAAEEFGVEPQSLRLAHVGVREQTPAPDPPVQGDVWYRGVTVGGGPEQDRTGGFTSDYQEALKFAQNAGPGGRVNVYRGDQIPRELLGVDDLPDGSTRFVSSPEFKRLRPGSWLSTRNDVLLPEPVAQIPAGSGGGSQDTPQDGAGTRISGQAVPAQGGIPLNVLKARRDAQGWMHLDMEASAPVTLPDGTVRRQTIGQRTFRVAPDGTVEVGDYGERVQTNPAEMPPAEGKAPPPEWIPMRTFRPRTLPPEPTVGQLMQGREEARAETASVKLERAAERRAAEARESGVTEPQPRDLFRLAPPPVTNELERRVEAESVLSRKARAFARRRRADITNKPEWVQASEEERSRVSGGNRFVNEQTTHALYQAIEAETNRPGGIPREVLWREINDSLDGRIDLSRPQIELPAPIRKLLDIANRERTKLQEKLAAQLERHGKDGSQLPDVIRSSVGFYQYRGYKAHLGEDQLRRVEHAFSDPEMADWQRRIRESLRGISEDLNKMSDSELDGWAINLVHSNTPESKTAPKRTPDRIATEILSRRTDLPPVLRELLGEFDDPVQRLHTTLYVLDRNTSAIELWEAIRSRGEAAGKLSTTQSPKTPLVVPGTEGTPVGSRQPLAGVFTDEDTLERLTQAFDAGGENVFQAMNRWFKLSHTVYNPPSSMRDWASNPLMFSNMSGRLPFLLFGRGGTVGVHSEQWANLWAPGSRLMQAIQNSEDPTTLTDEELFGPQLGAIRSGAIPKNVQLGEMLAAEQGPQTVGRGGGDVGPHTALAGVAEVAGNIDRKAKGTYLLSDSIWAQADWNVETKMQMWARGETEEQARSRAGEIVNKTRPNYDLNPAVINLVNKYPLVGTYVAFHTSVPFTAARVIKQGIAEVKEGRATKNGKLAALGALRLGSAAGVIAAHAEIARLVNMGVYNSAVYASGLIKGLFDSDEDEAKKAAAGVADLTDEERGRWGDATKLLGYPWMKNGNATVLGYDAETGNILYLDHGFLDAFDRANRALHAARGDALKGTPLEKSVSKRMQEAVGEILDPFTGESFPVKAFKAAFMGIDPSTGREIDMKKGSLGSKVLTRFPLVARAVTPDVIYKGVRLLTESLGSTLGDKWTPRPEVAAAQLAMPMRPLVINPERVVSSRAFEFSKAKSTANSQDKIWQAEANKTISPIKGSHAMNTATARVAEARSIAEAVYGARMYEIDGKRLYSDAEIKSWLKKAKLSDDDIRSIFSFDLSKIQAEMKDSDKKSKAVGF